MNPVCQHGVVQAGGRFVMVWIYLKCSRKIGKFENFITVVAPERVTNENTNTDIR